MTPDMPSSNSSTQAVTTVAEGGDAGFSGELEDLICNSLAVDLETKGENIFSVPSMGLKAWNSTMSSSWTAAGPRAGTCRKPKKRGGPIMSE